MNSNILRAFLGALAIAAIGFVGFVGADAQAVDSHELGLRVDSYDLLTDVRTITTSTTLTAKDGGKIILANATDLTITLPAASTVEGVCFTIAATATAVAGGSVGTAISPASADAIAGNGLTSVDNKDLINTAGTDAEYDSATICSDGGDQGWLIKSITGTWAKEA